MDIPGLPPGFDLGAMMKQAQEMQDKLQREMAEIKVDASSGGGMVSVSMSGSKELLDVRIDPQLVADGDVEMLQDMVLAAVNEATRKVDEKLKGRLGSMLPPGLGF
ncbi:MAG TPA: YbaB/EbfC family nucleoid-associated protein [Blastocatellia bacterium]|nr:YbaB/EbfC family nucleoid-associated protein [Blastocatellia bacterium]